MRGDLLRERLRQSPLFILGLPRSGTTLLTALLDGHPQLLVAPHESHFFSEFLPKARGLTTAERCDLLERSVLRHLFDDSDYRQRYLADIDPEHVRSLLRQLPFEEDGDCLSSALIAYGRATGLLTSACRYWVEKTPDNERYVEQIYELWPAARCIHVMRDPRALYDTYRARRDRFRLSAVAYAWRRSAVALLENRVRYESSYLPVRYEDLASDLEGTLARIVAFLAIDDDPALQRATKTGGRHLWKGNSAHSGSFAGEISSQSIDRWRRRLSAREVQRLESLLADLMLRFDYQPLSTGRSAWPELADRAGLYARMMRDGVIGALR